MLFKVPYLMQKPVAPESVKEKVSRITDGKNIMEQIKIVIHSSSFSFFFLTNMSFRCAWNWLTLRLQIQKRNVWFHEKVITIFLVKLASFYSLKYQNNRFPQPTVPPSMPCLYIMNTLENLTQLKLQLFAEAFSIPSPRSYYSHSDG